MSESDASNHTYREILKREFESRKRRNPAYSLRAFARDLGMPAPKLSTTLNGKTGLSGKRAAEVAERLELSADEKQYFIALVEAEHSRSPLVRRQAAEALHVLKCKCGFNEIDLERFKIISDWYHFAILELSDTRGFKADPEWIAERLAIPLPVASAAIERLNDFGLIAQSRGTFVQTQADLATPSGIPSREIREHHMQILAKAAESIASSPISERDFSSVTMAIDSSKITEAAEYLKEFRRKFCRDLQAHEAKDRVYCLSIQFFPLDKMETGK